MIELLSSGLMLSENIATDIGKYLSPRNPKEWNHSRNVMQAVSKPKNMQYRKWCFTLCHSEMSGVSLEWPTL
jgi:hypothetical protein